MYSQFIFWYSISIKTKEILRLNHCFPFVFKLEQIHLDNTKAHDELYFISSHQNAH